MCQGTGRGTDRLDPTPFIQLVSSYLDKDNIDEVLIRRFISGLYHSIFNYWGLKKYLSNKKGKGLKQDNFSHNAFYKDLLSKGMDRKLLVLLYFRIAADHHVLNPTSVKVYISKTLNFPEKEIHLTKNALKKTYQITLEILGKLNQII